MLLQDQCATHGGEALLAGLDRKTGHILWMQRFGNVSTFPEVWRRDGKMQHEEANAYGGFLTGFCPPLVRMLHSHRSALQGAHMAHRKLGLTIRVPLGATPRRNIPVIIQRMQWKAEQRVKDEQGRAYYAPAHQASVPLGTVSIASLDRALGEILGRTE
jgi:hypothetical protein